MAATDFQELAKTAAVAPAFLTFLKAQGIETAEDYARTATTEEDLKCLITLAESGGVKFDRVIDKVAPKKLWVACRKSLEVTKKANQDPNAEAPLPDDSGKDIRLL